MTQTQLSNQSDRLHNLCTRCKRLASALWAISTTSTIVQEAAQQHGFIAYKYRVTGQWTIIFAHVGELMPDDCHLCAIVRALVKSDADECWARRKVEFVVLRDSQGVGSLSLQVYLFAGGSGQGLSVGELAVSFCGVSSEFCGTTPHMQHERALQRAKGWIEDCVANHSRCERVTKEHSSYSSRPSRILDLAGAKVVLKLTEHILEPISYLTLSHMWGIYPERQLRLTTPRLEEMQIRIPEEEIPDIFRTAIRLTRDLGYQYLWIDSLCIIQDCKRDWEIEAAKMAQIYNQGVCNLSFLQPPEAGDGQLWADPLAYTPCIVQSAGPSEKGFIIRPHPPKNLDVYSSATGRLKYWAWLDSTQWPLFTRAWAFQEQFLCRRTILYQHHHLAWECVRGFCDETLGPIHRPERFRNLRQRDQSRRSITKGLLFEDPQAYPVHFVMPKSRTSFDIWSDLVLEYRARHLTFPQDRTMALAGVARRFASIHNLTYLAGAFLEHMPHSLLWWMVGEPCDERETEVLEQPAPNVPSWSWFSSPIHRVCRFVPAFAYPFMNDDEKIWARVTSFQWDNNVVNTPPDNAFYNFSTLNITIEAISFPATLHRPKITDHQSPKDPVYEVLCSDLQGYSHKFTPDLVMAASPETPVETSIAIRIILLRTYRAIMAEGLVLVPGGRKGTWRRLGHWSARASDDARSLIQPRKEEDGCAICDEEPMQFILV